MSIVSLVTNKNGNVKVWRGQCPAKTEGDVKKIMEVIELGGRHPHVTSQYIAIEINLPSGPMIQYAMVGANFIANRSSNEMRVVVSCATETQTAFCSEIATEKEAIFWGIAPEYLPSVIEELKVLASRQELPSGEMLIDAGAYSIY